MNTLDVVGDEPFARRVLENPRPVLVLFTAPGCPLCDLQARWLGSLAGERDDAVEVVHCPVEVAPRTAAAHGVASVPQLTLFHDGRPLGSHIGVWPSPSIRAWIQALLQDSGPPASLPGRDARRDSARAFFRTFCSSATRVRACKVAGVVAPLLLLVNHGELLLRAPLSLAVLRHLALNFLVPFLVASYSIARAASESTTAVRWTLASRERRAT